MNRIPGVSAILLLAGAMLFAQQAKPPEKPASQQGMDLKDVNVHDLTLVVQRLTGKTFLWNEELGLRNKRVHFVSDKPVMDDPEILFKAYQSILQVSGFALNPAGKPGEEIYKIASNQQGAKIPVPLVKEVGEPTDRFVTRVFSLQYVNPRDVQAALLNMASFPQALLAIEAAGILLATDYDYNIKRLEEIILAMDVKKPDVVMKLIQLRNAVAPEVQTMMDALVQTLIQRSGPGASRIPGVPGVPGQQESVKVVSDKRTNSVILLAEPTRLPQLEEIVRSLDSETPFEASGVYVVHLRHTNAKEMEETLTRMYGGSGSYGGTSRPPGIPGGVTPPGVPAPISMGPSVVGGIPGAPTIVRDERSNSIIVVSDRTTFKTLEGVIRRLDQRRPQVLIKATVVEIRSKDTFDLGVELSRLEDPANRIVGGGRTTFGQSTIVPDPATNTFTITPIPTPGITLLAMKDRIGNIGALLTMLNDRAKVKILDEPEVATNDNGYAEIKVTSQIPVLQTTVTGVGTAQTTFNRFETAETTLSITPHISESGYLRLRTKVKIEKFTRESADPVIPPPKNSREIETNEITIPNGSTMVIGGIVTQDESDSVSGVPGLMDIPILGMFFRRQQQSQERRTLFIFLTPYILYDHSFGDYRGVSRERVENMEKLRGDKLSPSAVEDGEERLPASTFRIQRVEGVRRGE